MPKTYQQSPIVIHDGHLYNITDTSIIESVTSLCPGRSVCLAVVRLVGLTVCHNFFEGWEVTLGLIEPLFVLGIFQVPSRGVHLRHGPTPLRRRDRQRDGRGRL